MRLLASAGLLATAAMPASATEWFADPALLDPVGFGSWGGPAPTILLSTGIDAYTMSGGITWDWSGASSSASGPAALMIEGQSLNSTLALSNGTPATGSVSAALTPRLVQNGGTATGGIIPALSATISSTKTTGFDGYSGTSNLTFDYGDVSAPTDDLTWNLNLFGSAEFLTIQKNPSLSTPLYTDAHIHLRAYAYIQAIPIDVAVMNSATPQDLLGSFNFAPIFIDPQGGQAQVELRRYDPVTSTIVSVSNTGVFTSAQTVSLSMPVNNLTDTRYWIIVDWEIPHGVDPTLDLQFQARFTPLGDGEAVPEPATALLVLAGAGAAISRRRA